MDSLQSRLAQRGELPDRHPVARQVVFDPASLFDAVEHTLPSRQRRSRFPGCLGSRPGTPNDKSKMAIIMLARSRPMTQWMIAGRPWSARCP